MLYVAAIQKVYTFFGVQLVCGQMKFGLNIQAAKYDCELVEIKVANHINHIRWVARRAEATLRAVSTSYTFSFFCVILLPFDYILLFVNFEGSILLPVYYGVCNTTSFSSLTFPSTQHLQKRNHAWNPNSRANLGKLNINVSYIGKVKSQHALRKYISTSVAVCMGVYALV